jgi:hypothetical protein
VRILHIRRPYRNGYGATVLTTLELWHADTVLPF